MNQQIPEFGRPAAEASPSDTPWIGVARGRSFVATDGVERLMERALVYLNAGVPVHLRGMAGLGKTSIALSLADALGRPVAYLTGNQWLTTADLVGREVGQSSVSVVDKYIHTVRRTETVSRAEWQDSLLAIAMERGHTLVYDEFTRASPEANAALLSVLEEGVLVSPDPACGRSLVRAAPNFRVILTSNPHDYVGVKAAPDALLDRVITLEVEHPSPEALTQIIAVRAGLEAATARRIVRLLAAVHERAPEAQLSSVRAGVLIGRVAAHEIRTRGLPDDRLAGIAADVLGSRGVLLGAEAIADLLAADGDGKGEHA